MWPILKRTQRMSTTRKWSIKFARKIKEKCPNQEAMRIFSSLRAISPAKAAINLVRAATSVRAVISPVKAVINPVRAATSSARVAINPAISSITSSLKPLESKTQMPKATQ